VGALSRLLVGALAALAMAAPAAASERWQSIFNGRNLDGWTPKVNHRPLGENWRDTFVVKNGTLRVSYDNYGGHFTDEFAHLIYKTPLSSYRLRLEYRFLGPSAPGVPAWAIRNSGVMLHGQAPETMALDEPYPISVEAQLLGGARGETRPTGNVCTPGTTVSFDGQPMKAHCRNSTSPTFQDGEWVRFEVEVHGRRLVRQYVNGVLVLEYGDILLDPSEFKRFANVDPADAKPVPLDHGYISLQGESSPVEFRKIELMRLPD
jgi:hypothetical protein